MSEDKYKIIIQKDTFQEEYVFGDEEKYLVGTSVQCKIRLQQEIFESDFILIFCKKEKDWYLEECRNIHCHNISLPENGQGIRLSHGTELMFGWDGKETQFTVSFFIAFDEVSYQMNRRIDIANYNLICIGSGSNCNVRIASRYCKDESIELRRNDLGFDIKEVNSNYGIYHNGQYAKKGTKVFYGDFVRVYEHIFCFYETYILTDVRTDISGLKYEDRILENCYPKFCRNTRVKHMINEEEIEILGPPAKVDKPEQKLLTTLLSPMGFLIVAGIMAFRGGTRMFLFSGISATMGIATAIVGMIQTSKKYKVDEKKRRESYQNYITNKENRVIKLREEELELLNQVYYSEKKHFEHYNSFSGELFDRTMEDSDFLHVYLGRGRVESKKKLAYKKPEQFEINDELQKLPEELCEKYKYVENAPITCDFQIAGGVGIVGDRSSRRKLLETVIFDICARQYYSDVKLFLVLKEEDIELATIYRKLPYMNQTIPNHRNIVCDAESRKVVFEFLYTELSRREESKNIESHYIVFLYDLNGFENHPVSKYVKNAKELGVTFVFFAEKQRELPIGCKYLIECIDEGIAELIHTENDTNRSRFNYVRIDEEYIKENVQVLSAVVTEEISLEGDLTKNIDLYELLGIYKAEEIDLFSNWNESNVQTSMAVPLGVSKTRVVQLDLHDKAHGPHGLVAGTTGSGKSEILQSYILSTAIRFHPYEVGFLIIDFKGGGMVNQFAQLPHLLGAITNIDEKEIMRSLKSIRAELKKRQQLFAEAQVNHIDKYIAKYKQKEVSQALPHLIIIVDEFAELKAEQPDFMKELISTARIGRSLGVHLILATQKPAGQVDEQIWSNSKFKLCLKVQSAQDSNEVLKSPLAAEIKEPGRAYLQVGNNELFELFQSAYSGAPAEKNSNHVKEFSIYQIELSGKQNLIYERRNKICKENVISQLDAIVAYVKKFCNINKIEKLPNICIDSLKECLIFKNEMRQYSEGSGLYEIGIYDDPDNQYQGELAIDIEQKHTLIVGSSQKGKTNFLLVLLRQIASRCSVRDVNIYLLDFSSMFLKNFEKLNHVGGVICTSDDEKLRNFMKVLSEEIVLRKEQILSVGVSSHRAYVEAGYKNIPHIYVMIDNFTAFKELYLENDDSFLGIMRDGISVGITMIVTNASGNGLGYKYLSNFSNNIALYCNDKNEYGNLFQGSFLTPSEIPGRCIIELEKKVLECQIYLSFQGEKEIQRAEEIKRFIAEINGRESGTGNFAKPIPYIPDILEKEQFEKMYPVDNSGYKIPIGLTYNEIYPFIMDLKKLGAIGICGKEKKGHKNFIKYLLGMLERMQDYYPVKVYIFDSLERKYKEFSSMSIVEKYTVRGEEVIQVLEEWHHELTERYQKMLTEEEIPEQNLLVMIIENSEVPKIIEDDMDAQNAFNDVVGKYRNLNACFILSNYENDNISFDAPEILRFIKQSRKLLYFDDLDNLKVFDVSYDKIRANRKKLRLGDAYYIEDNQVEKIKVVKA